MSSPGLSVLIVLATATAAVAATSPAEPAAPAAAVAPADAVDVGLLDMPAIRREFRTVVQRGPAMTEGERVAAWADFSIMADAVAGRAVGPFTFEEIVASAQAGQGPRVRVTRGAEMRDAVAYQMLSLGYSARETADVVTGRISRQALDMAQRMIAVGQGRDAAANYLDGQYKLVSAMRSRRAPALAARGGRRTPFDAIIDQYANLHQVESAIVRAIIETESAFNPLARSHAGAIGLMQLMPGTARELGVNPFVPEQNIEGGIRYFSQLLKMFGGIELALVAYNAGPGFAQRYARGQTALYGETRDYVRKVLGRLAGSR